MEIFVIFMVILVLFGPRRLPEIAKMIGRTLNELRRASEDFKDQVLSIDTVPPDSDDLADVDDVDVDPAVGEEPPPDAIYDDGEVESTEEETASPLDAPEQSEVHDDLAR
jgi:sec-independent protein translocase protein TatB